MKGIERNLKEMGYAVYSITGDFDPVATCVSRIGLFIMYLPDDIMEDTLKQKKLSALCGTIRGGGSKLVLIGEQRYHQMLLLTMPELARFKWFDRPIEIQSFSQALEKIFNSKDVDPDTQHRILIVDDDPSYAGMVREWIKEYYRVDIVTAGMMAISFLLKNKVDLVLLDYEMPVVDGPQVFQMLRQEPATKDIPVIFLTGVGTREEVSKVMALKPDGYILKSTPRDKIIHYLDEKLM
ncbi:MAG: response regulator [Lachnospiraceae bacterium]|nr:response regulator [Lachnospiraceae bacterium]